MKVCVFTLPRAGVANNRQQQQLDIIHRKHNQPNYNARVDARTQFLS